MHKNYLLIFLLSFFATVNVFSANCTSTGNGPWIPAPVMWSCGHIPNCTDSIIIRSTDSIWISNTLDYTIAPYSCAAPMYLTINGVLAFQTGKKLILPAGSIIIVSSGGRIRPGGGGGNSNLIEIGGVDVWNAAYGTATGPLSITESTPLPVELIYFNAQLNSDKVELTWITASETNNDYFTIQKTLNGSDFESAGEIDGSGNSSTTVNYSFTDQSPYEGKSYYRLKQTDFNGNYAYSPLIPVNFKGQSSFSFEIYPNPKRDGDVFISIEEREQKEILVVVYDVTGKESYSKVIVTEINGNNVYAIDNSNQLSTGVYIITATSDQKIYSKRLVVK